MMLALTTAAAAHASEKIDTVEVKNAQKVVIVTSDTAQQVTVVGNSGRTAYDGQVPLNEYKMRKLRKAKGKYNPWDVDPDLGVGFATPLSTSDGYGFATFRSREIFFGVKFTNYIIPAFLAGVVLLHLKANIDGFPGTWLYLTEGLLDLAVAGTILFQPDIKSYFNREA